MDQNAELKAFNTRHRCLRRMAWLILMLMLVSHFVCATTAWIGLAAFYDNPQYVLFQPGVVSFDALFGLVLAGFLTVAMTVPSQATSFSVILASLLTVVKLIPELYFWVMRSDRYGPAGC